VSKCTLLWINQLDLNKLGQDQTKISITRFMSKQHRIWMLGAVLLVSASTAAALSLGRARGAVLLGRGLDLSIQTTLEAQEPLPEANCFVVDVFYGDTRISPSAVSIAAERVAGGEARIRVRASVAVDEPVVTLYVRAGCGASVARRYVLLADTLTEAEPPVLGTPAPIAPAQVPRIAAAPVVPASPALAGNSSAAAGVQQSAVLTQEERAARQARAAQRAEQRQAQREQQRQARRAQAASFASQVKPAAPQPSPSVLRDSGPIKKGGPRLQVDLLDLASVSPNLRGSVELSSTPSTDPAVRSQALALWRSLSASPEDALREVQRVDELQTQMRNSLEQSKRQAQDIVSLNAKLQESEKARYINLLTIALGLLTLLALAACAWMWRRNTNASKPWWGNQSAKAPQDERHLWEHLGTGTSSAPLSPTSAASPAAAKTSTFGASVQSAANIKKDAPEPRSSQRTESSADFAPSSSPIGLSTAKIQPLGKSMPAGRGGSMGRVDNTPPPAFMPSKNDKPAKSSGFGNTDFAASNFATQRVVAAEELFDIQEQADFFMSLGQPDQAIEVLKNHISDNVETSALAFMDLFDIYHRTGAEKEYIELREEFNRVFNAQVPNFASHGKQARGLEDYPEALKSIQQYWPGPQVLEVIEESIFRQPDAQTQPFDMLAYRELMLLYTLAKELSKPGASFTPVQAISPISASAVMQLDSVPDSAQGDLGVDLSLDDDAVQSAIHADSTARFPASNPAADSLDFDLSDMDELREIKKSSNTKSPYKKLF
jgi:hypothetical protein